MSESSIHSSNYKNNFNWEDFKGSADDLNVMIHNDLGILFSELNSRIGDAVRNTFGFFACAGIALLFIGVVSSPMIYIPNLPSGIHTFVTVDAIVAGSIAVAFFAIGSINAAKLVKYRYHKLSKDELEKLKQEWKKELEERILETRHQVEINLRRSKAYHSIISQLHEKRD